MDLAEFDRRRGMLNQAIGLTMWPRPLSGAVRWPHRPANDETLPAGWIYYLRDDGQWGVGDVERGFGVHAVLPSEDAVGDWLWEYTSQYYRRYHVSGWSPQQDVILVHQPLRPPADSEAVDLALGTDPEVLRRLSRHPELRIVSLVASNTHAPMDVLGILAHQPATSHLVANNLATPRWLLSAIARRGFPHTVLPLLANPNTPAATLAKVAPSTDAPESTALLYLAGNPSTRVQQLEQLARHPHHGIRWSTLSNRSLPRSIADELAVDADFGTRWWLEEGRRPRQPIPRPMSFWPSFWAVVLRLSRESPAAQPMRLPRRSPKNPAP